MHSRWKYKNGFRKLRNVFRLVQLKTKSKTETVSAFLDHAATMRNDLLVGSFFVQTVQIFATDKCFGLTKVSA